MTWHTYVLLLLLLLLLLNGLEMLDLPPQHLHVRERERTSEREGGRKGGGTMQEKRLTIQEKRSTCRSARSEVQLARG
jgi:hypothetical protein